MNLRISIVDREPKMWDNVLCVRGQLEIGDHFKETLAKERIRQNGRRSWL